MDIDTAILSFRSARLPVLERGEEQYERSVATPNLLFRFARPDFVLQPETVEQVQAIVRLAKAQKLALTIKCGGHSYAGHSTANAGSVSLDLYRMKQTKLDMASRTITFAGGCQWGNVYKTLINGGHDGFVVNGGRCPTVGVGGFLLGGGLGPFSRSIGMGSDTVKEISLVLANGELVTVKDTDSRDSDKGRLFWALRGAGGGSFGVVVEMKLSVIQLRSPGGIVVAGRYQWFSDNETKLFDRDDFRSTMNTFYTTAWPDNITIDTTWICNPRNPAGDSIRFTACFDGGKVDFDATIDRYIKHEELARQLKRRSLPEKSTRFLHETLAAQWSDEAQKSFPVFSNSLYMIYSSFVFRNERYTMQQVMALLRHHMSTFRTSFRGEDVEFWATFIHSGGQMSTPKPVPSAFPWRDAVYHMYLTVEWKDKWMEADMRRFLDQAKKSLRPLSLKGVAAFVNFPDGALSSEMYERAYWGDNREELRLVKQIWDKDNFFQSPQGVRVLGARSSNKFTGKENDEVLTDSIAGAQWEPFRSRNVIGSLRELRRREF